MEVKELPVDKVVGFDEVLDLNGFRRNRFYREAYEKASRYFERFEVQKEEDIFLLNFTLVYESCHQISRWEYNELPTEIKKLFVEDEERVPDTHEVFYYAELVEEQQQRAEKLTDSFIALVKEYLDDILDELDKQS